MAKKKLDKLATDAQKALAAGLSYGKWKAMQAPVKIEEKPLPEGWKKCEYCGKPFKKFGSQRYCELGCRTEAYKQRESELKMEYMRKYRERKGFADG